MLCPLFFLLKSGEGKIRTANPQYFTRGRRIAALYNFLSFCISSTNQRKCYHETNQIINNPFHRGSLFLNCKVIS